MKLVQAVLTFAVSLFFGWAMPAAADTGHCSYVQQGHFETHQVCETPVDAAACAAIGETERRSEAVYVPDACRTEGAVGTCDKGATRIVYFDGDPTQLEIGCGFQGGTWLNP